MYSAEADAEGMERLVFVVAEQPATEQDDSTSDRDGAAPAHSRHRGGCRGSGWWASATTYGREEQIAEAEASQQREARNKDSLVLPLKGEILSATGLCSYQ